MKSHTTEFKNTIKNLGRELRAVITYGNVTIEEEIYAVTPHFEGGILKSIMKQLDLELSVDIPLETVINCQIGILVNGSYEMLNFGNYVVYKSEKQEDTNTYKLTCYDKMLYSMKQNEELGVPYPISIKNYLIAICNKLGLTLRTTTFQNESRMIQNELYLGLEYTYRDILDEIAQATGSIICLNENDEVLVKYPTQTNDTIDEEFLKDVNVDFGQMYGAINTIVLSRSGESDNIYYPETLPENPIEIKIKDNQIMNWNDRSDYLPGIYNALNGLYYYINDFSSTGILYYEVGDLYNVQVGNNTYQCLMLNDEINITTGIEEIIHTDLPEQSETDYTKADKTDRRINQTYLIVDKQNQQIESLITTQTDQNQKIARVTQTVDELNSKISDIADITTSLETNSARLEFEGINQSEPIRVVIHPVGVNISKLYPSTSLKPSTNLTIKTRILRFTNTTTEEVFDYELPDDLLYYDSENYDEFQLDYDGLTCIVNKKCKWNNDGTVGLLTSERTDEYTFPHIELTDGNYIVQLIQYSNGYIFARLMAQNIYTTQFATKAELNSDIRQTVDNINLSVNQRLTNYSTTTQMNSAIDLKANQITSSVSETYATKSELNSSTSSLNSKIDQTAQSISLSVDSVQEQVETAQSTANSAVTKADNAQTSANSAQNTANTATTKADNAQTSANNAQATANNINNNLATNYYTKTQTNSAINQKADSITSTVSQTYSTKTETNTAKNQAINSANSSTDAKLQNYSTTAQMNSAIEQKANQIAIAVSETYSKKTDVISEVNVEYALGTSTSTAPTTGWSTIAPTWQSGKYMWQRTTTIFADGSTDVSTPTCIAGAKGQDGTNGTNGVSVSSITEYYAVSSSNSTAPADSAFKTTMQTMTSTNKYLWNYEVINFSNGTTQNTNKRVIGTYGDKGQAGTNGTNGKDGIGIKSVTNKYQVSTSNTTAPTTWKDTPQTMTPTNKYLWNYEIITYSDNTTSTSTPAVIGAYGDKGNAGTNGVSVSSITEYYAVSTSNSSAPADSSFQTAVQTMTTTNKYLWNYELITYSNNTTQKTAKRVIGVYGDKGTNGTNGTNGIGISSIVNKYAVSSSNSTAPSSWSNTPQTMTATNKYLWNYEIITYSNNTTYTSTPAVIGTYGEKGNTGDTGKGVKAVVAQYYLSSSKTTQTGGSWSETQPTYRTNYYYWTRTKITWTDNTTTYTTPILVEEINSLNESVASLNIRAGNIESTVRTKVGNDEIISKINQSAEAVQIDADKISLNGKTINLTSDDITINSNNFSIDKNGNITATGGTIGGFGLSSDNFETELNLNRDYTTEDSLRVQNIIVGNITPTQTDYEKYDFNNDEKISGIDLYWVTRFANNLESKKKKYVLDTLNATKAIQIFDETLGRRSLNLGAFGSYINYLSTLSLEVKNGPSIRQGGIEIPTTVGNISIGNMNLDQVDYSWLSLSNTNNGHSVDVSNDFIQFWTGNALPTLVYSGAALYENNSGSTGTITLRDYAYNYDFLEIYFADHNNGNIKQMIKVENPDGKNAQMQILSQSGTDIRVNVQRATISGKNITKQYGQVNYMRGGNYTTNEIYIEKVIGYRSGYPDY